LPILPPTARLTCLLVAVAAVGFLRTAWVHFRVEPLAGAERPLDERFAPLRALLPERGSAGYLGEGPPGGERAYLRAAYALSPLLLRPGDLAQRWVVVELADPAGIERIARREGLRVVARGEGVALLQREVAR
jgi:hypothetical protein